MATKRIKVEIKRSTQKAHLITSTDGREGWVQKRWLKADSTVSIATFEKSVAHASERKSARTKAADRRNSYHPITVTRETEKAVAVSVELSCAAHEQFIDRLVWFPKSCCQKVGNEWQAMGWLINTKMDELLADPRNQRVGAFVVDPEAYYGEVI